MTPTRLCLSNFMAYEQAELDYAGARLVVAVGENGAGKSSLMSEAIEWVLFGKSRVGTDDVVRWGQTDASVQLTFTHGGATYRVVRMRSLRSGGKSSLELHIATEDGWRPLTGASIAETQAQIERLLGMDHATFRSSVLLKQSDLARFAKATAGDRKRILGQVLGLDIYGLAEARAREQARDVDRDLTRAIAEVDQLAEKIAGRQELEHNAGHWRDRVAALDDEAAGAQGNVDNHQRRLTELAQEVAAISAAQDDIERLTGQITDLQGRWRAADARRSRSDQNRRVAGALLEQADSITAAAEQLPQVQAELAAGVEAEQRFNQAREAVESARRAFETENEAHRASTAEAEGTRAGLVHTVAELEAAVAGLGKVTCPRCSEVFAADPADLAGRLHAARQQLLNVPEPKEPLRVGTLRGQLARRESDLTEAQKAHFGGTRLDALRRQERDLELQASRAPQIDAARAAMAAADQEIAAASDEMKSIEEQGKRLRDELAAARQRTEGLAPLAAERDRIEAQLHTIRDTLIRLAAERDQAATARGRAEAALEQLAVDEARHAELSKSIESDRVELGRLRKLVTAFGTSGIPARIVESVLPEFAGEANQILADTLPGWQVEMRAQRARKSGDGMIEALDLVVLRDGAERPFEAASGGQQTVLVLALALALSRLAGRRTGATIRYFGVDEPDGLDQERRRMFGQALRQLAHKGDLELVSLVTHNEDLAEFGDQVVRISQNGHGSQVEVVTA